MKNKFDKFLLTFLWLIICLLATCFWFNIKYGFNIFSQSNWELLAYMQAAQQPINITFYISLVASVLISLIGLYLLIRPSFRKISNISSVSSHSQQQQQQQQQTKIQPKEYSNPPSTVLERPKRLNTGTFFPAPASSTPHTQIPHTTPFTAPAKTKPTWDKNEISNIFKSAHYTLKPTPKIQGLQTILFAIGSNENIWVGATDCTTNELSSKLDVLHQIFLDTLDEIEININAFILNATPRTNDSKILTFDNIESLRNYINMHPNTPPDGDEQENFDAFSAYISTVIEYLGNI